MNFNNLGILAILASAAAFWQQLRAAVSKFLSFFIRTDTVTYSFVAKHLLVNLLDNSKIIRWGNATYSSERQNYLHTHKYWVDILSRAESSLFLLYQWTTPIIVKQKGGGISVTYLYKTFKIKELLDNAYLEYKRESIGKGLDKSNQFYISEVGGQDVSLGQDSHGYSSSAKLKASIEVGGPPSPSSDGPNTFPVLWLKQHAQYVGEEYKDLSFFTEEKRPNYYWTREALVLKEKMIFWRDSMEWFIDRGIQYRFSALLYGKPGCGKTKMVVAAAQDAGIPIKRLNIANMSDAEFLSHFDSSGNNRMVILIEDIDVVFGIDRQNKLAKDNRTKSLVSFDTIINAISGIKDKNGIFLVITSNHKDQLDSALIRPGRCDVHIEVGYLDKAGRQFIANNILRDWLDLANEMVENYPEVTVADFEKKCIDKAIEKYYNK